MFTDGVPKIPSLPGFLHCDTHLLSYHKLNILLGAISIGIFGWKIASLRGITLLFYAALLFAFSRFNRRYFNSREAIGSTVILCASPLLLLYGYTYRPEIWVAFFGFLSFAAVYADVQLQHKAGAAIAGFFAGLAFLTHLNGLIFILTGAVVYSLQRKIKPVLFFCISAGIISLFYFWDLRHASDLQLWFYQLKNWPDNNITNYGSRSLIDFIKSALIKLLKEHQRFFWSYKVWFLSAGFFAALLTQFNTLRREHSLLLTYTLLLILFGNVAGSQIAERYLIYYLPLMSMIVFIGLKQRNSSNNYSFYLLQLCVLLQAATYIVLFNDIRQTNGDYTAAHASALHQVPAAATVMAPYTFVFEAVPERKFISFKLAEYTETLSKNHFNDTTFIAFAQQHKVEYFILPKNENPAERSSVACLDHKRSREIYGSVLLADLPYYRVYKIQADTTVISR